MRKAKIPVFVSLKILCDGLDISLREFFDSNLFNNFELRVIYSLNKNELTVTYDIKNVTDGDMYFSIGAHEAYSCPNGISEWLVIFDKAEDLIATPVDGPHLTYDENVISKNTRILPLEDEYFAIDALVFLNLKSRKLTLKNDKTGYEIKLDFDGFPYLLIWIKPNAKYISSWSHGAEFRTLWIATTIYAKRKVSFA